MKNQVTLKNQFSEKKGFLGKYFKLMFFKKKVNLKNNFRFVRFYFFFKFYFFIKFHFFKKIKTHKSSLLLSPIKNKSFFKIKNFRNNFFNLNYVFFKYHYKQDKNKIDNFFFKNNPLNNNSKNIYNYMYFMNNIFLQEYYSLFVFLN